METIIIVTVINFLSTTAAIKLFVYYLIDSAQHQEKIISFVSKGNRRNLRWP
jgi:hypothetical protein